MPRSSPSSRSAPDSSRWRCRGQLIVDRSGGVADPAVVGRTIVLSSFLLGGPSGSGVATTVTLGTVAYPMLARAGYEKNAAGGLLAAGGLERPLGMLACPVCGAGAPPAGA